MTPWAVDPWAGVSCVRCERLRNDILEKGFGDQVFWVWVVEWECIYTIYGRHCISGSCHDDGGSGTGFGQKPWFD